MKRSSIVGIGFFVTADIELAQAWLRLMADYGSKLRTQRIKPRGRKRIYMVKWNVQLTFKDFNAIERKRGRVADTRRGSPHTKRPQSLGELVASIAGDP